MTQQSSSLCPKNRQRPAEGGRSARNRAPMPRHYHDEFRRNAGRRCRGLALAAFGYLNPFAALIHVTSELVFILNSARLLSRLGKQPALATSSASMAPTTQQTAA